MPRAVAPAPAAAPFDEVRLEAEPVRRAAGAAAARYPGRQLVYLTDTDLVVEPDRTVRLDAGAAALDGIDVERVVFVCYFDSDEKAAETLARITARGGVYFCSRQYYPVASYWHLNDTARRVLADELADQQRERFAKWNTDDFANLIQAIDVTAGVAGDYVEIGVYRGSSACLALRYMAARGVRRRSWFLDTFEGITFEDAEASTDAAWYGTHVADPAGAVRRRLRRAAGGDADRVRVVQANVIAEGLPDEIERIAVCNVDVDLYESVRAALDAAAPRIAPRGILIAEDAGHTPGLGGARLALNEFLASAAGAAFVPIYMQSGQTFLIRA